MDNIVQLYEEQTNELFQMNIGSLCQFTSNFHGKTAKVLWYIVDNMDRRTNTFYGTCKSISEDLHISRPTVSKILKFMKVIKVLSMRQIGVWEVDVNNIINIPMEQVN